MTRANTLTEIWNTYNDNIINEGKKDRPIEGGIKNMGTKPGPGPVDLNDDKSKEIQHSKSPGTTEPVYEIEGLKEPIDPKNAKKEDELYNSADYSSEKYNEKDKKIEKKVKESINNYMKSTFDKLFENVMSEEMHSDQETQELDALGIDTEVEETGEGDITVTLDRDMAKQLCDLLQAAMGEEDDDDLDTEAEDYEEMEEHEDGEHEDEDELEEATELHAVSDSAGQSLTHPGHNKVGKLKAKGKKASDSTKKYVDGEPKPLADGKAKLTNTKNNKVDSSLKAGADLID
tara:strand:+ start:393 stop:1259 length:867 start_codon:yes stop_codon:yes gene_type:complete